MLLCEQAAIEQNPAKLMKLVAEISRLLDEKQARLKRIPSEGATSHHRTD
jgi:hypothetical protein